MEAINFPVINRNLLEHSHDSLFLFQEYESKTGKEKMYSIKNSDKELCLQ